MIVNFPLLDDPNVSIIAWTTTPWTLPSNLAVCVNPDMDYVKVKGQSNDRFFPDLFSSVICQWQFSEWNHEMIFIQFESNETFNTQSA